MRVKALVLIIAIDTLRNTREGTPERGFPEALRDFAEAELLNLLRDAGVDVEVDTLPATGPNRS